MITYIMIYYCAENFGVLESKSVHRDCFKKYDIVNYSSDVKPAFGAGLALLHFSCITVAFLCIPRFYVAYCVPYVYSMCDLVLPIWRNKR